MIRYLQEWVEGSCLSSIPEEMNSTEVPSPDDIKITFDFIKAVSEQSSTLNTWTLSVLAGSILFIVSTSYHRSESRGARLIYLLFIPAWLFSVSTIYVGTLISSTLTSSYVQLRGGQKSFDTLRQMAEYVNCMNNTQIEHFQYSIFIYGLWLLTTLIIWIFSK